MRKLIFLFILFLSLSSPSYAYLGPGIGGGIVAQLWVLLLLF